MIIGTNQISYPQLRNFVGLPFSDIKFKKVFDFYKLLSYPKFKLLGKVDYNLIHKFNDFGLNKIDMFHFFNTITPVNKPWVVTFETTIPRPNKDFILGYKWMAKENCKQLIPFSQRAFDFQCEILDQYSEYKDLLISKMKIIKPSQQLILKNYESKKISEKLIFTFVGSAFFRKGGFELVQAFEILTRKYPYIELNIVTNFSDDGYCSKNITQEIKQQTQKIINKCPQIIHFNGLNNLHVIDLLLKSHYSILPSYSETFGYYLLESMACGCPVITSNLRPFEEVVSEKDGYTFDITPICPSKDYIEIDNPKNFYKFSNFIKESIINTLENVISDTHNYQNKVSACVKKIESEFNPKDRVSTLTEIYVNALK